MGSTPLTTARHMIYAATAVIARENGPDEARRITGEARGQTS